MKRYLLVIALPLLVTLVLTAQSDDKLSSPRLKLDLTLFDLPYQFDAAKTVGDGDVTFGSFMKGYANPSMSQSLNLTTSMISAAHFGMDRAWERAREKKKYLEIGSFVLADFLLIYMPGGSGWLHEEYHRALMTRYHVNSFNGMNKFPLGASTVSVSKVKDEDLVRFKASSSADFIRMHVAGIEGEYMMIDKLQRNNFFYNQNITNEITYLLTTLNSWSYVASCSKPGFVNDFTEEMNLKEPTIEERDFTGFDFVAWAYDLFNPDEPYEERGDHISGVGIDRYRKTTDLITEELSYLSKQGNLALLNFFSPMLYFKRAINTQKGYSFNFAVRHMLNSFGNDISINMYAKVGKWNCVLIPHFSNNFVRTFPSIEAQLIEFPYTYAGNQFLLSPKVILGTQPKNLEFKNRKAQFLGYLGCRADWVNKSIFYPWIELDAKTKGWIAGNEFQGSNISLRLGVSARFY